MAINILGLIGLLAILPSFFFVPALIVTAIMGAMRNDYTYFKKYLKFWAYSLLVLFGVMVLYAFMAFILATLGSGAN